MNKPLKLAVTCFFLGLLLPATPDSIRGDFEPQGFLPGVFFLLWGILCTSCDVVNSYYKFREEPTYDFGAFTEVTLIPALKWTGVTLAVILFVLITFIPRLRAGRPGIVSTFTLLVGGLCFARILFPGYPPSGNRYYYYPGAYLLIAAFPLGAYAVLRQQNISDAKIQVF